VLEQLGRLDEALDFTRQALALSLQIGDATIEGVSFVALGVLHNRLGQLAEAEDAFAQSIRLAEDSGDHRSLAKRYLNIAKSHVATGQIERALPSVFSSIEVAERSGNSNAESEARELAAVVYARLGEFATAAQHARSSLQLTRTVRNRLREGRVLFQLGRIMALEGKHTEAIDVLSQATEVLRDASPKIQREAVELVGRIQRAEAITFGPTLF
jgi:tetratricopeptide (TPR) repeat protein